MSDFFERPPPPPPPPRHRQPAWVGPPDGILPGVVALELLLAQSDKAAVCITRLAAYPTGFSFDMLSLSAPGGEEGGLDPMLFGPHHHRARLGGADLPPEFLRLGIQFSDGGKATNTSGSITAMMVPRGR